ncbi:MAG TPA: ATP-binding protein [Anaeromyxobacter sp.]
MVKRRFWSFRSERHGGDALVKAASEWRQTFDAIELPIVVLAVDGRVTRLNRGAQKLLGLEFHELIGRPIASIASWQPWQAIAELARSAAGARGGASRQVRSERGKEWQLSASFLAAESPELERIIIVARDVTSLVRLEASLRRSELMAALGTVVSGVAHEVRNPLFAISATVDAMEARVSGSDALGPFVETLRGEVERLSRLMRDLLDYGKPPGLDLASADLGQVVASAIRTVEPHAAARGIAIRDRVGEGFARARVDSGRIAQVVQNLVENAAQHAAPATEIEVGGVLAERDGAPGVELSVADRGPGFSLDDLPRAFDPFFTRRRGGTGLGLAIVRRLVEAHGGTVEARNRPGGGAVVSFWIPLSSDAGVEGDRPASVAR